MATGKIVNTALVQCPPDAHKGLNPTDSAMPAVCSKKKAPPVRAAILAQASRLLGLQSLCISCTQEA